MLPDNYHHSGQSPLGSVTLSISHKCSFTKTNCFSFFRYSKPMCHKMVRLEEGAFPYAAVLQLQCFMKGCSDFLSRLCHVHISSYSGANTIKFLNSTLLYTNPTVWVLGFGGWELTLFASVLAHSLLNHGKSSSLVSI